MIIRKATEAEDLEKIEALYMQAFPKGERKPWKLLVKRQSEGTMELLSIEDEDGSFLGLAIFAFDKDLALLDYFAITENRRGQGTGSEAIGILQERYKNKRFLLEIESTKHPVQDLAIRKSRKAFYLRNGLHPMNFDVNLFGIEMEVLSNFNHLTYEEYLDIYKHALGREFSDQIFLIGQNDRS